MRQITKSEAEKLGISESPQRPYIEVLNERTGKLEKKYEGVSLDFASNSGQERGQTLSNFLNDKVENISKPMAEATIKDCIQSDTFKTHYLSGNKQDNGYLPIALISNKKVKEKLKLDNNTSIRFSGYTSEKGRLKHKDIKQEDYLLVQDIVDNGELIDDRKANHWIGYKNYDEKYNLKSVFKKTSKNEIYLQTLFKILKGRK